MWFWFKDVVGQRVLVHRKRKGGKELGKSWAEERGGFKDERKRERDGSFCRRMVEDKWKQISYLDLEGFGIFFFGSMVIWFRERYPFYKKITDNYPFISI